MYHEFKTMRRVRILSSFFGFGGMLRFVGFNAVAGNSMLDILTYLLFISSNLLIMCYLSAYGTEMIRLSTDVSVALTDHPWYDGSIYYQRMLPFPIARVERPGQLLLTTSYQLFTLTKTRCDEQC
uniref:Odorant receptor n=1 Tax=Glossina pallidipes TaxID=7398 RepID=A0A1B0A3B1_GLOPL